VVRKIVEQCKSGREEIQHQPELVKHYERCALAGQLTYCFDSCVGSGSRPREKSNAVKG